jgi:hypothetical protein
VLGGEGLCFRLGSEVDDRWRWWLLNPKGLACIGGVSFGVGVVDNLEQVGHVRRVHSRIGRVHEWIKRMRLAFGAV